MSKSTAKYIANLEKLKEGELSILRILQYCPLDETLDGFDLFTGLWWPLRAKDQFAPQREVAWLIARLFARYRLKHNNDNELPVILGRICSNIKDEKAEIRFISKFDQLFRLSNTHLDHHLSWALGTLIDNGITTLDWIKLTDDLSIWDKESTRITWVNKFNDSYKRITNSGGKNAH